MKATLHLLVLCTGALIATGSQAQLPAFPAAADRISA